MASQKDPRRYEAEDADFLDREENYVMKKSANMKMSRATAKNRREPSHQYGVTKDESTRKTQAPAGAPRKASTVGIVAQAVQRLESHCTLEPPPPVPVKKQKHDKHHKGKRSNSSDEDSLTMHDIFPHAFKKNGSSRSSTRIESGNRSGSIYIPVVQQPWNEKSVMYSHASTIGATNVGTHYMKDLEFDDDDRSLDIVEVFPVLKKTTSLNLRRIETPTPAPQKSIVAAVQAAAQRAEAATKTEKAQIKVSQHPPDSKGRGFPLPLHPSPVPQGSGELPKDSSKTLERKKSKKLKKESSRKKSHKHSHEESSSLEDKEARRERRRRKKEKKAKKKARENEEEKSRKKKKKHKKHSRSDSYLHTDDIAPIRRNSSMPHMSDKEVVGSEQQMERTVNRAGLNDYIRDRDAIARQSMISIQSGQTTIVTSNVAQRETTSLKSTSATTVKQSNVAKKESRAHRKSEEELTVDRSSFLSGKRKEKELLSDSAQSRKSRLELNSMDAGLSDSGRSRKVDRKDADAGLTNSARSRKAGHKAEDDNLSDSARFRKARAESRKVAAQKETLAVRPTSSQSTPPPIKRRPPIRPPETREGLKGSSRASLETSQMDSVGKFDMLAAVDSAVQAQKAEKKASATRPVPPIADTKKKKSHNFFKSIFSRKTEKKVRNRVDNDADCLVAPSRAKQESSAPARLPGTWELKKSSAPARFPGTGELKMW